MLETLLAPFSLEKFLGDYWEKKPFLLARQSPNFYRDLLTLDDLQTIIAQTDLRYPALKIFRDHAWVAPQVYTRNIQGSEVFHGVPEIAKVRAQYKAGATLVLLGQHLAWPPLRKLCSALEDAIGHGVKTSVYITPPGSEAFSPHTDPHHVFVLQIHGEKTWRTYSATQQVTGEIVLKQGDLLYLPKGCIHAARTLKSTSAHITIGVQTYSWVELLAELLKLARGVPELRKALPLGFHREGKNALVAAMAKKMAVLDDIDKAQAVEAFIRGIKDFQQSRPEEQIEL